MTTIPTPLGPVAWVPRNLVTMPRNSQPPAVDTSRLRGVTLHYAGGPIAGFYGPGGRATLANDTAYVRHSIAGHVARPGLTDVGYNLFLGRTGTLFEGRGLLAMNGANGPLLASLAAVYPEGTRTSNPYFVSVHLAVGTDIATVSAAQAEALPRVLRLISDLLRIRAPFVNGHGDVRATACPGPAVRTIIPHVAALAWPKCPPPTNPRQPEWGMWPDNPTKPTIGPWSNGPAVAYLHGVLIHYGYTVSPGDGYGLSTAAAVRSVQRSNGLPEDGTTGPATWAVVDTLARRAS